MRIFKDDMRRAVMSKSFFIAALLVFLMYMQDGLENLLSGHIDAFSLYKQVNTIGSLHWLVPCVGALAFSGCYVKDKETHSFPYFQMRMGNTRYCVSKCFACFLSAMLATVLGVFAFLGVASWQCDTFFDPMAMTAYGEWGQSIGLYSLIGAGHYILFTAVRVMLTGMVAGLWALFGLMLTAFWPNIYMALLAPAIVCYFKDYLFSWMGIYNQYNLKELEWCEFQIQGLAKPLGISLGGILSISLLLAVAFTWGIRRRVRHG